MINRHCWRYWEYSEGEEGQVLASREPISKIGGWSIQMFTQLASS